MYAVSHFPSNICASFASAYYLMLSLNTALVSLTRPYIRLKAANVAVTGPGVGSGNGPFSQVTWTIDQTGANISLSSDQHKIVIAVVTLNSDSITHHI
jgi:hypothetical protein